MTSQVPIESDRLGGAITINVFAGLSALALVTIMLRMIFLSVRYGRAAPTEHAFYTTNFGCYAVCLMLATTLNTVAGLISMKWTVQRAISDDVVCRVQVAIMQLGNWSTAFFTLAIAIHTFNSLVLRIRQSTICRNCTVFLGWATAFTAAVVPVALKPYEYGPTVVTCDFKPAFPKAKFLLHILPILISSFLSATMYSITFLVLRGTLSIRGGVKLTIDPIKRWSTIGDETDRFVARIAGAMLWFPVAYISFLVPYSIMQLLIISGFNTPFVLAVISFVLWFLLGLVNVLLVYNVFRVLEPAIDSPNLSRASLLPMHRESQINRANSWSSRSSEYGLPEEYNNIIRSSPMNVDIGRHIVPRANLARPEFEPAWRSDAQPVIASQLQDDMADRQGLSPPPPPLRPPRPQTLDSIPGFPDTMLTVTNPDDNGDQQTQPDGGVQRLSSTVKSKGGLRPAISAVAARTQPGGRNTLNGGSNPPDSSYI